MYHGISQLKQNLFPLVKGLLKVANTCEDLQKTVSATNVITVL